MAVVLCTGVNRSLIMTRVMLLESAGHRVTPAMGVHEVVAACAKQRFDVAVIGQAITPAEKIRILHLVRENCPGAMILELYRTVDGGKVLRDADDWLEVPVDVPSDLPQKVEALAASNPASSTALKSPSRKNPKARP
jgi:hypothetical protein